MEGFGWETQAGVDGEREAEGRMGKQTGAFDDEREVQGGQGIEIAE